MQTLIELVTSLLYLFAIFAVILSGNTVKNRVTSIAKQTFNYDLVVPLPVIISGEIVTLISGIALFAWLFDIPKKIYEFPYSPQCWIFTCASFPAPDNPDYVKLENAWVSFRHANNSEELEKIISALNDITGADEEALTPAQRVQLANIRTYVADHKSEKSPTLDKCSDSNALQKSIDSGYVSLKSFFASCPNPDPDLARKGSIALDQFATHIYLTDTTEAMAAVKLAIELDEHNASAHLNYGKMLGDTDDRYGSKIEIRKAIMYNPNLSMAHYNYALILENEGNLPTAIDEYNDAVRLDKTNLMALNNLGHALNEKGNYAEAINVFNDVLKQDNGFIEAHIGLCRAYKHERNFKMALAKCMDGIKYASKDCRLYNELGSVYSAMGQLQNAAIQFEKGLQLKPGEPTLTANLAMVREHLGK